MQYLDKPIPKPDNFPRDKVRTGDAILLFNTTNVKERIEKIKKLGIKVYAEDDIQTYPTAAGETVKVCNNTFFDKDGIFIKLNEVLEGDI